MPIAHSPFKVCVCNYEKVEKYLMHISTRIPPHFLTPRIVNDFSRSSRIVNDFSRSSFYVFFIVLIFIIRIWHTERNIVMNCTKSVLGEKSDRL